MKKMAMLVAGVLLAGGIMSAGEVYSNNGLSLNIDVEVVGTGLVTNETTVVSQDGKQTSKSEKTQNGITNFEDQLRIKVVKKSGALEVGSGIKIDNYTFNQGLTIEPEDPYIKLGLGNSYLKYSIGGEMKNYVLDSLGWPQAYWGFEVRQNETLEFLGGDAPAYSHKMLAGTNLGIASVDGGVQFSNSNEKVTAGETVATDKKSGYYSVFANGTTKFAGVRIGGGVSYSKAEAKNDIAKTEKSADKISVDALVGFNVMGINGVIEGRTTTIDKKNTDKTEYKSIANAVYARVETGIMGMSFLTEATMTMTENQDSTQTEKEKVVEAKIKPGLSIPFMGAKLIPMADIVIRNADNAGFVKGKKEEKRTNNVGVKLKYNF